MENSIDWFDPEGFALTACLDERSQPLRWRVVAQDLLYSRPGAEFPDPAQCESSTIISTVLFPPSQTVLAAGVVKYHGLCAAASPRSVIVTASTQSPDDINPRDTHQPLQLSLQQHRAVIHVWELRIRRRLSVCALSPAVPPSDTNPGPCEPSHAHYSADGDHSKFGANLGSKRLGLTLTLHEVTGMPLPQGISSAGFVCRPGGAGVGALHHHQKQQQVREWDVTNGCAPAAGGGSWRCSLAHTGAWAVLQVSSTRTLLIGFGAALEPTVVPVPHFPDPVAGGLGTTAAPAAPIAAGPGSSVIETTQHQIQLPHQDKTTNLHCLDLDLTAAVAATSGESSSFHVCQVLSCYGYAGQVVLDVALTANARRRANSDLDDNDSGGSSDDNVGGHSVLLRLGFPVKPISGNSRSGRENEPTDDVAQGGGGEVRLVRPTWGTRAAVTASVQLRGQISICSQLHSLAVSGSRRTKLGKTSPTGSIGTSSGAAIIDLPALIGVHACGHLYLIGPYSRTVRPGVDMDVGEIYLDRGTLKAAALRSERAPAGDGPAALSEHGPTPPPLALAVVAQLTVPGPVISIHPLPRIRMSAMTGSSIVNADGDTNGCGVDRAHRGQGHPGHGAELHQIARTAAKAAFAAALCTDPARSVVVLRVMRWQNTEDAQLAARLTEATAVAECEVTPAAGAAGAGGPRPAVNADGPYFQWSLQQLLIVPGVQAVLPVPLPSALSLALAPGGSGYGIKNDAGADADCADRLGASGGDAVRAVRDSGVAVLVSPAAVLILGGGSRGAQEQGPARRGAAGGADQGVGHQGGRRSSGDVWMRDEEVVEEDERMANGEEDWGPAEGSDDDWGGGVYTQRQCLHPPPERRQHGQLWQQQAQQRPDEEAEEERGGGGGLTALGPVGLGPWRRVVVLPAEVQPLPPQVLLAPGGGAHAAATKPPAAAAAPRFAAGAVTELLLMDSSCDTPPLDARPMQWGRPEQEHAQQGGLGSIDGRSGAQEAGMAKVLAHMSRRWDAGVQHALEQRAALGRMVHLTREAEHLIAAAGQEPLPTYGSAGARPPAHASLLDPLQDLEEEFRSQPQRRARSRSAMSKCGAAGPTATCSGRGGDGDEDGDNVNVSAAVDKLLDQLLGCGSAGPAKVRNIAGAVPAVAAAYSRSESRTAAMHGAAMAVTDGAKSGGGEGGAASDPRMPDNGSWSPVVESLTQSRQGGNWILRAVLRLEGGQKAGAGYFAAVAKADGNGKDDGSGSGHGVGGMILPLASGPQHQPPTPPLSPLQLDDVVLLPYCPAGLALSGVRGRWEVLQRRSRQVMVEAAVPLGELLGLASAAAVTATPGGCLDPGFGAERDFDPESHHRRDLQTALGPLPGLFDGPNEDGGDTVYSDECSSDTDNDREDACNHDDLRLHDYAGNGIIGSRPAHGNSSTTRRSTHCKLRELQLGAMLRITARVSGSRTLEDGGGRSGGSTESSSARLLQVRVLDLGRVLVPLDSLLQSATSGSLRQQVQQQQAEGGRKDASTAGAGGSHGSIGAALQPPPGPAMALLLAPSRSLLLIATTEEAAGLKVRMPPGVAPVAAAGGGKGLPSCASASCRTEVPQWTRGQGMCGDLWERLLWAPGFLTRSEHDSAGVPTSEAAEDVEDHAACRRLLWEGLMGWRCVVSLQPCGVYGCEVELSCINGGDTGWDAWSAAALDQVQQLVTEAAERSCEQVGRGLSLLCPNPLADCQLRRMDTAAGALQRCVDATLDLFEGALLAQQQQQHLKQQQQQQQQLKQQQQTAGRREVGTKSAVKDCTAGSVGSQRVLSVGATGGRLQAMLQDVLQLQLQLNTAMETYLVS
ncbi:hypothetical protein VaNZ11_011877 [Volvox africanus]|uniref:Uncharacterized protein n=1 Tax=Volvox africanus TaxID=51714 RepID=A0ABQ5SDA0_9CHLO|nr:hypothetical protein VaNZ11_011877 [Volvox africanus]